MHYKTVHCAYDESRFCILISNQTSKKNAHTRTPCILCWTKETEWATEQTPFKWNVCLEKFLPYILFLVVVFRFNHSILSSPRVFCYRIDLFASLSTFSTAKPDLKVYRFIFSFFFACIEFVVSPKKKLYHSRIIEL